MASRRPKAVALAALGVAASAALHRLTHRWGSTDAEHRRTLPGDDLVAEPAGTTTFAVTVAAPAEEVWRWLVQLGQDRGGMYSYDRLENLVGLDIHSTDRIRDEWQHLAVGDRVVLVPDGWAGMKGGYSLPVALVDPPRTIVLRQAPPEHPWDAVWTFHVEPTGPASCRLISRSRSRRHAGPRRVLDSAVDAAMSPVTFLMTRRMLLGIKARAERA